MVFDVRMTQVSWMHHCQVFWMHHCQCNVKDLMAEFRTMHVSMLPATIRVITAVFLLLLHHFSSSTPPPPFCVSSGATTSSHRTGNSGSCVPTQCCPTTTSHLQLINGKLTENLLGHRFTRQ